MDYARTLFRLPAVQLRFTELYTPCAQSCEVNNLRLTQRISAPPVTMQCKIHVKGRGAALVAV